MGVGWEHPYFHEMQQDLLYQLFPTIANSAWNFIGGEPVLVKYREVCYISFPPFQADSSLHIYLIINGKALFLSKYSEFCYVNLSPHQLYMISHG